MKYARPDILQINVCCGQSVSRKTESNVYVKADSDIYICHVCKKEDYLHAFNKDKLSNDIIHCFKCKKNTSQYLQAGHDNIMKTKCRECRNINVFDLSKQYCNECNDYVHHTHHNDHKECNVCHTKSERFPISWGWIDD